MILANVILQRFLTKAPYKYRYYMDNMIAYMGAIRRHVPLPLYVVYAKKTINDTKHTAGRHVSYRCAMCVIRHIRHRYRYGFRFPNIFDTAVRAKI